jgi:thioredoxin reductase (NADPH)
VINILKKDQGFVVETENKGRFEAKHVILATGVSLELAEKIGVETKARTEPRIKTVIQTDGSGRTNVEGVWAAGTCAGVSVHTIITAADGAKVPLT